MNLQPVFVIKTSKCTNVSSSIQYVLLDTNSCYLKAQIKLIGWKTSKWKISQFNKPFFRSWIYDKYKTIVRKFHCEQEDITWAPCSCGGCKQNCSEPILNVELTQIDRGRRRVGKPMRKGSAKKHMEEKSSLIIYSSWNLRVVIFHLIMTHTYITLKPIKQYELYLFYSFFYVYHIYFPIFIYIVVK